MRATSTTGGSLEAVREQRAVRASSNSCRMESLTLLLKHNNAHRQIMFVVCFLVEEGELTFLTVWTSYGFGGQYDRSCRVMLFDDDGRNGNGQMALFWLLNSELGGVGRVKKEKEKKKTRRNITTMQDDAFFFETQDDESCKTMTAVIVAHFGQGSLSAHQVSGMRRACRTTFFPQHAMHVCCLTQTTHFETANKFWRTTMNHIQTCHCPGNGYDYKSFVLE